MAVNVTVDLAVASAVGLSPTLNNDHDALDVVIYLGEYHNKVLDESPFAYWRLDEYDAHAGIAADSSGNAYDGTRENVVAAGETIGDLYPMALFDGDYDYIDIGVAGMLGDFSPSAGTLMIWYKLDSSIVSDSATHLMAIIWSDTGSGNRVSIEKSSANEIQAIYEAGGTIKAVSTTTGVDTDLHFIVFTWDVSGDEIELFIDGVSKDTESSLGTWDGSTPNLAYIARWVSSQWYFEGYLAHCALFDSVLDSAAIARLLIPAGRDVSQYANNAVLTRGKAGWDAHIAPVGQCTIEFANVDKRFSPEYTLGPYYGELVIGVPVRVDVTDGVSVWTRFRGWATYLNPDPDQYALNLASYQFEDVLGVFQASDVAVPLRQDITAAELLTLVASSVFRSGLSQAFLWVTAVNTSTLTIGTQTYYLESAAGSNDDEVYYYTQDWGVDGSDYTGAIDSAYNMAAAINRGDGAGTVYATTVTKHENVTAEGYLGLASPATLASALNLAETTDNYTKLATAFRWRLPQLGMNAEPRQMYVGILLLRLRKVGSPTGTITVKLVKPDSDGKPTSTLLYTGAEATIAESSLSTSYTYVQIEFPVEQLSYLVNDTSGDESFYHWIVVETDRSPSGTDYVQWNYESFGTDEYERFSISTYAGSWATPTDQDTCHFFLAGLLRVRANARGVWGNVIALDQSSTDWHWDDSYSDLLAGGSDGLAGYLDLSDETRIFSYGADSWTTDVNGVTALDELSSGEFGLCFVDGTGNLKLFDRHDFFTAANQTPRFTVDNAHNIQVGAVDVKGIINYASVTTTTREITSTQAVARANNKIEIPGRVEASGLDPGELWNHTLDYLVGSGQRLFILPYVSPDTGNFVGAVELELPPVAGTDYTVSAADGYDYTYDGLVEFTTAITAAGIQILATNKATGSLFLENFQIRGKALKRAESLEVVRSDADSREAYRTRKYNYNVPLPGADSEDFAADVADHVISQYAEPSTIIREVGFEGEYIVTGVHTFSLNIGDVIHVKEEQTQIDQLLWIVGVTERLATSALSQTRYFVMRVDRLTYWILGVSGFTEVGETTRVGL